MTDSATLAQNIAADPLSSTWLSANAGSGKTRVLTNRVARLLLHGVEPQNILCLTYTKAAASEMQNRLFQTLGSWAMLDEQELRGALSELGEDPPADLSKARTLFAGAIEAPGGLKIQTIHSLCSSILRRFPLESGVTPAFRELDETGQKQLISDVLDDLADSKMPAIARMSLFAPGDDLVAVAANVAKHADDFASTRSRPEIFAAFDVPLGRTADDIFAMAFQDDDLAFLKSLAPLFLDDEGKSNKRVGAKLAALSSTPSVHTLMQASDALLTGGSAKTPFAAKIGALPTKPLRDNSEFQPFLLRLETLMRRVEDARAAWVQFNAAVSTEALHAFARVFLPGYEKAKEDRGVLDFDDLIRKTRTLLTDQSLPWVLYRLDARIEHILVDEAQDTSPRQWDVIRALTEELTSGSEDNRPRTLFVVGDKKQSIYSFQGADAESFDQMARQFEHQLAGRLAKRDLQHSFRSSSAILSTVDAVFRDPDLVGVGENVRHEAFHDVMPGRVDLWPLQTRPDKVEEPEWFMPVDRPVEDAPAVVLSAKLAQSIKRMLENETIQGRDGQFRPVRPGDIMILVQGRGGIFGHLIQACKSIGLQIAGADRLKIAAEMAVRDLVALLSFLALPDDSLSLAATLKSPLFGWSERQLYDLAAQRETATLWQELRRRSGEFAETHAVLRDLRDKVDFARPYELIEMILTHHHGRRKLVAHIGPEAEDGIDELLNQALAHERNTVPSLTGFLSMIQVEDIMVKRQADGSDDLIRVMTVHGAKGLERPIVILPDTTMTKRPHSNDILLDRDGMPVLPLKKDQTPDRIRDAGDMKAAVDQAERNRLLYVAMTRAEKWLIVCGVEPAQNARNAASWHAAIEAGLKRAGGVGIVTPDGSITRLQHGDWPDRPTSSITEVNVTEQGKFPDFLRNPVSGDRRVETVVSPSGLGGAKVVGGGARDEAAAMKRGHQIHLLLEHLPGASDPEDRARRLLSSGPDRADPSDLPGLVGEARRNLEGYPELFGPRALAEVDVAAHLPELDEIISGTIDRLLVTPDRVLAVDFKTNAHVPVTAGETPEGLLRQMGAYLSALEQIYPDRPVEIAILWTVTGQLMTLPHGIVREALGRATTS